MEIFHGEKEWTLQVVLLLHNSRENPHFGTWEAEHCPRKWELMTALPTALCTHPLLRRISPTNAIANFLVDFSIFFFLFFTKTRSSTCVTKTLNVFFFPAHIFHRKFLKNVDLFLHFLRGKFAPLMDSLMIIQVYHENLCWPEFRKIFTLNYVGYSPGEKEWPFVSGLITWDLKRAKGTSCNAIYTDMLYSLGDR